MLPAGRSQSSIAKNKRRRASDAPATGEAGVVHEPHAEDEAGRGSPQRTERRSTTPSASRIDNSDHTPQHLVVVPDESVAATPQLQPASQGPKNKQRITWTQEMNEYVIRCYFEVTKLESTREPHGAALHRKVLDRFPELQHLTVQHMLRQRRSIVNKQRVAPDRLNQIKEEVAKEMQNIGSKTQEVTPASNQPPAVVVIAAPTTLPVPGRRRTKWTKEMNEHIVRCYFEITRN